MSKKTINSRGTVESKVRELAENQFPDCAYIFANFAQANVYFDKIEKPTIMYLLPPGGSFIIHHDRVREKPSTQLWFLCPSDFDFDSAENDCRAEAMKRLGLRFIHAMNNSGMFMPIEKFRYEVAYDAFDMNLTGVCFPLELEEKEGLLLCDERYEPQK